MKKRFLLFLILLFIVFVSNCLYCAWFWGKNVDVTRGCLFFGVPISLVVSFLMGAISFVIVIVMKKIFLRFLRGKFLSKLDNWTIAFCLTLIFLILLGGFNGIFLTLAQITKVAQFCYLLPPPWIRLQPSFPLLFPIPQISGEHRDLCFLWLAKKTGNESLCEKIKDEILKMNCYVFLARWKKNPNLCEKLKDFDKEFCYKQLAYTEKNPAFCEKTGSHRYSCYTYLATELKDVTLCEKGREAAKEICLSETYWANCSPGIGKEDCCQNFGEKVYQKCLREVIEEY